MESARKKWINRAPHGLIQLALDMVTRAPSQHVRRWLLKLAGVKIGDESVIYAGAEIRAPRHITIGRFVSIGTGAVLDGRGGLQIGDCVNLSSEVMLWTMQHDHRTSGFEGWSRPIVLEQYVWLGPRVIVLPGVTVAKGCVVGAGAVVTKSTEPFGIYAGVPAKRVGERIRDLAYTPGRNYIPII